jgi:urease accessory protein
MDSVVESDAGISAPGATQEEGSAAPGLGFAMRHNSASFWINHRGLLRSCAAGAVFLSIPWATSPAPDWLLWQLADSAFPTGGFAHSGGLEAAWQQGRVRSAEEVAAFTRAALHQAIHGTTPFLLAAFDPAADLLDLDDHLDSMLSSHVANRASRLQGQALLSTAHRVFGLEPMAAFREHLAANRTPGHLPVVLALVARALQMTREQALRLFLFMTMRSILSAAVRLGVVGPLEAQHLQASLSPALEALAAEGLAIPLADAAQTSPLLELWQGSQDRLYSRLFQS